MKKRSAVQDIVLTSLFMGIVFVMGVFPNTGYINLGAISVTVVHVPVIVGALLLGWRNGLLIGVAFGIGSFVNATTSPLLLAPVFLNPLVSIFPRIIFGGMIYFIYKALTHTPVIRKNESLVFAATAAISTLLHTLMVIPLMYYVGLGFPDIASAVFQGSTAIQFLLAIMVANGVFEIIIATVLVPIIMRAFKNVIERN